MKKNEPTPRPREQSIERSQELYEVGYFLCRYGQRQNEKPTLPPKVLETSKWVRAYAVFYSSLSTGRTLQVFCNTLKNVRDLFDGHVDSGRIGWQEDDQGARKLTGKSKAVFDRWCERSESDLWGEIKQYAELGAAQVSNTVLADELAQLDSDHQQINLRTEGGRRVVVSTRVERNPTLRNDAIRIHGTRCMACDFCFEQVYGEWGKGFIEVHHLIPLGDHGSRATDPRADLIVLCANCHRMVHRRRGVALTLEELRLKIQSPELSDTQDD